MYAVLAILIGIILYGLVYRYYVKWVDKNVMMVDPKRATPAHVYMDGIEYFPSNKYVLFGFQWKSIAALGPVLGPILAIQWGWLPAFLWILFGTIFIGWIHDYGSMMVSVRSEGASFGPITYELISPRARTILLWYILWYIVLILSSFTNVVGGLLNTVPQSPLPLLVTTVIGVIAGYLTYKLKVNIVITTVIAIIVMYLGVYLGLMIPIKIDLGVWTIDFWMWVVLIFCFLGAVLPIWVFIQPINYLSFYLVYFGIIGMIIGTFSGISYASPTVTAFFDPAVTFSGPLWPMLFVTVACGAISGWHSLIGSSITSKQLDNEADGSMVAGGAMIAEGIMALVALTTAAILAPDVAIGNIKGGKTATNFVTGGSILLNAIGIPLDFGKAYATIMLVILAITIMHIGLRITRLVLSELAGPRLGGILRNKYLAAIIVMIIVWIVTSPKTGASFAYLWPTFGGANQLMAGLALMIITLWLLREKRRTIFTSIPMFFMIITTISALIYLSYSGITGYIAAPGKIGLGIAAAINIILIILAIVMVSEGYRAYRRIKLAAK
ncbi:MAG: carbon starvation CstA family protein [Candidatus Nezhaarchaeales archaeon]